MKYLFYLFVFASTLSFSQNSTTNTKNGFAINGYDVVSYFDAKPLEGKSEYTHRYKDVNYKFSSQQNLELFVKNPEKYLPEYGGYCAYAIGKKGKKVGINPETFEIKKGKLYLFYNKGNTNTLQFWLDENTEELRRKADENWKKINQN